MSTAIEFNNISKQYRLGLVSTRTLSHDLNRWWTVNVRHKEDPYLKIGSVNDRASAADSEYVWALKDIDFKVEQGDVVGIIGKNGAGKSTLLKLLSKVTAPTTGTICAKGRIGSLLEVGTGFHPEMTGRENIFMNGAIMGMTKNDISRKLDEIVAFSGCERYIDTPVKRYSSGMTVRLGFAVAAFMEPEILVVDEVLAVGDAEFQKKAICKMQDVSQGAGRTVLFVSHNMASIRTLCKSAVLLKNGMVEKVGGVNEIVDSYLFSQKTVGDYQRAGNGYVQISDFSSNAESIDLGENLIVDLTLQVNRDVEILDISFDVTDDSYSPIAHVSSYDDQLKLRNVKKGDTIHVQCEMRGINFAPGSYSANVWLGSPYECYDWLRECIHFYVNQNERFIKRETPYDPSAKIVVPSIWKLL